MSKDLDYDKEKADLYWRITALEQKLKSYEEKELKVLNEILTLHDKWLGNGISDFEFFTLLSEIREVLL